MSGFNFKTVLNKLFYEEPTGKENPPTPTAEEQEAYAAAVTSDGSDIVEQARQFIINSQITCDTDELPDISHVLNAVETAGSGEDHELIRRMLQNLMSMNPDDLKQDGLNRKEAILKAIEAVKAQDTTCISFSLTQKKLFVSSPKRTPLQQSRNVIKLSKESQNSVPTTKLTCASLHSTLKPSSKKAMLLLPSSMSF